MGFYISPKERPLL